MMMITRGHGTGENHRVTERLRPMDALKGSGGAHGSGEGCGGGEAIRLGTELNTRRILETFYGTRRSDERLELLYLITN